jgi:hypothetical protein
MISLPVERSLINLFYAWTFVIRLVGCSSGAFAQFLASPTDLVKVIMQVDGKRRLEGKEPRIKNVNQAFVQIYKEGGIRGLWRGSVVNVQRAALVSLGGWFHFLAFNVSLIRIGHLYLLLIRVRQTKSYNIIVSYVILILFWNKNSLKLSIQLYMCRLKVVINIRLYNINNKGL